MKVSIITVCFDAASTIERTLISINEQTYSHIEHIVIDGQSKDKSMEIITALKQRQGVVISEPDQGIYEAMNKGLDRATGDIICFLNADDKYTTKSIVADVVRQFEDEQVDAVYGDVVYVSPEGQVTRKYHSGRFDKSKLKFGWMPAHPSLFVRTAIYKKVGGFKPTFKIAGDFEMCCRIFQIADLKSRYLPMPFVEMLIGGASELSFSNVVRVNREIRTACKMNDISTNYFNLLSRYGRKIKELSIMAL